MRKLKMEASMFIPFEEVAQSQILGPLYKEVKHWPIHSGNTRLCLENKQMTVLRPGIAQFTSVTYLNLNFNRLSELPSFIDTLVNLETLLLTGNTLEDLPASLANLPKLKDLRLTSNCLTQVPKVLLQLPTLRELYLNRNPFESEIVFPSIWKSLKCISIENCNQKTVSPTINLLTGLKCLDLGGNFWVELPSLDGFDRLDGLTIDNMKTPLPALPETVANFTLSLTFLSCFNSGLRHVPEWICDFRLLETLHLGYNELKEIPSNIGKLRRLELLGLCQNKITRIPKSMALIQGLRKLLVSNNPIEFFPRALYKHNKRLHVNPGPNYVAVLPKDEPKKAEDPHSLIIQAARRVASMKLDLTTADLPKPCLDLVNGAIECSTLPCRGIYIAGSGTKKSRIVRFKGRQPNMDVRLETHTCHFKCYSLKPKHRG